MLSAWLNIYGIWNETNANAYYTAAVTSMLQNPHNFFFGSFDPGGFVTVDKPPVVFWIQTASAAVFGVHGWSVILPQALAGVGSVLLIYALVKPSFGIGAARLSALALACTPIAAAVSRTNNIDSMLVFTLLAGAWLLFSGVRRGKLWPVMGAFALIGVGFNMKMLQAYMVLPAFYLFYLIAFRTNWKKKVGGLAAATAVLLAVSLSWPVAVDSIPASQRPYIGSSQTNSVLELAFGYDGISRLTGNRGQDGVRAAQPDGMDGRGGGGGGSFGTGTKGAFRLFQPELAGQASWLIPFAFAGAGGILASLRKRHFTVRHQETLFWLAWLIPGMIFFSIAGFFHHYYLIMLAPPVAALAGAGWQDLQIRYRSGSGWLVWLFPSATGATTALQWYMIHSFQSRIGAGWYWGIAGAGILATLLLIALKLEKRSIPPVAAAVALLMLLAGPLYWAATPITYGQSAQLPEAGPGSAGGNNRNGGQPDGTASRLGGRNNESLNEGLYAYLKEHQQGEKFLFAATRYSTAVPYIIEKGEAVMAMGGYSGSDPILTAESLQTLVEQGAVRFFLLTGGGGGGSNSGLTQWVIRNGKEIPASAYSAAGGIGGTLYEVVLDR
jgi:4-amino-4-deoxy-L-arabinose transferase-like glycosyltransferase